MHDIARRVYDTDGAAPTLHTCGGGNLEPKIICEGNYSASNHNASRIESTDGIAPAVMENHGTVTAIIEPHTAALRGRNPENPSDRTAGAPTVQKDSLVVEPQVVVREATKGGYATATIGDSINLEQPKSKTRRGRVGRQKAQTLTTSPQQAVVVDDTERFFKQAIDTVRENDCDDGDTVDAYNKRINHTGIAPTITTRPEGFKTAVLPIEAQDLSEPAVLRRERNEYGKAVRKEYESHTVNERRSNMTDYVPREDGVSNTITTVTKDNYLAEPPTGRQVRVRKLTERECFRLMGVADADFDRVAQNQSKSGLYHMAGDSIVTTCLMAIFAPILGADYHQKIEQLLNMLCANNAKGAKS